MAVNLTPDIGDHDIDPNTNLPRGETLLRSNRSGVMSARAGVAREILHTRMALAGSYYDARPWAPDMLPMSHTGVERTSNHGVGEETRQYRQTRASGDNVIEPEIVGGSAGTPHGQSVEQNIPTIYARRRVVSDTQFGGSIGGSTTGEVGGSRSPVHSAPTVHTRPRGGARPIGTLGHGRAPVPMPRSPLFVPRSLPQGGV